MYVEQVTYHRPRKPSYNKFLRDELGTRTQTPSKIQMTTVTETNNTKHITIGPVDKTYDSLSDSSDQN